MIDFNGEKLRLLREEKCLTQRELASRAGVTQVYLSKIECNNLIKYADKEGVFGVIYQSRCVSRC